jgi:hypothetical protein
MIYVPPGYHGGFYGNVVTETRHRSNAFAHRPPFWISLGTAIKRRASDAHLAQHWRFTRYPLLHATANGSTTAEAFKFGYLVLRGPADFLNRFGVGSLTIDVDEVVDFAWSMRHELMGGQELLPDEIEIIDEHNLEATAYERAMSQRSLALVRS